MKTINDIKLYDQIQYVKGFTFKNVPVEHAKHNFEHYIDTLEKINENYYFVLYKMDKFELHGNIYLNFLYMRIKRASVEQELLKKSIN